MPLTTIGRTFRTYSYANEVGHFVSCSEYFIGTLRDLIGKSIDWIIVIHNKMQRELIFAVEFKNEKSWDRSYVLEGAQCAMTNNILKSCLGFAGFEQATLETK